MNRLSFEFGHIDNSMPQKCKKRKARYKKIYNNNWISTLKICSRGYPLPEIVQIKWHALCPTWGMTVNSQANCAEDGMKKCSAVEVHHA